MLGCSLQLQKFGPIACSHCATDRRLSVYLASPAQFLTVEPYCTHRQSQRQSS